MINPEDYSKVWNALGYTDEQLDAIFEECECPFEIHIREETCKEPPKQMIVSFRATRFHPLSTWLLQFALWFARVTGEYAEI